MIETQSGSGPVSATAKFYFGFFIALALVVAIAFGAGYRAGIAHAQHRAAAIHAPTP